MISLVLLGICGVFGYAVLNGWRTKAVRLPVQILNLQAFERAGNPRDYWAIMIVDLICFSAALIAAAWTTIRAGLV